MESLYDSFQFLWSTTTNRIWFSTSHLFLISNITNLIQTPQYKTNLPSFSSVLTVHKRKRRKESFNQKGLLKTSLIGQERRKTMLSKKNGFSFSFVSNVLKFPPIHTNHKKAQKKFLQMISFSLKWPKRIWVI